MSWENLLVIVLSLAVFTNFAATFLLPTTSNQPSTNILSNQIQSNAQTLKENSDLKPALLPYLLIVLVIVALTAISIRVMSYVAKLRSK